MKTISSYGVGLASVFSPFFFAYRINVQRAGNNVGFVRNICKKQVFMKFCKRLILMIYTELGFLQLSSVRIISLRVIKYRFKLYLEPQAVF